MCAGSVSRNLAECWENWSDVANSRGREIRDMLQMEYYPSVETPVQFGLPSESVKDDKN